MPRRVNGRQSGIVDEYGSHHRCYGRIHTKKDGNSVVSYKCNMVRFKIDANVLVRNSSRFNQDDLFVCGGKMQQEFSPSGEMIREVTKVCHEYNCISSAIASVVVDMIRIMFGGSGMISP